MSTKVQQQVSAALDGIIEIVASHTTGRACGNAVKLCQHHRRTVIEFRQSGCHNAYHTLLPVLVIEHDTRLVFLIFELLHNLVGLFRHLLIYILALFIILVDVVGFSQCLLKVTLHQQIHSLSTVLHTSGGVDARSDLKHDITHCDLTPRESADVDNRLQTHRRTR